MIKNISLCLTYLFIGLFFFIEPDKMPILLIQLIAFVWILTGIRYGLKIWENSLNQK